MADNLFLSLPPGLQIIFYGFIDALTMRGPKIKSFCIRCKYFLKNRKRPLSQTNQVRKKRLPWQHAAAYLPKIPFFHCGKLLSPPTCVVWPASLLVDIVRIQLDFQDLEPQGQDFISAPANGYSKGKGLNQ